MGATSATSSLSSTDSFVPIPTNRDYQRTTGLAVANPFLFDRYRMTEYDAWWAHYTDRIGSMGGWGETLGISGAMHVGMKWGSGKITGGLRKVGLKSGSTGLALTTVAASSLMSGLMILYQTIRYGHPAEESFLKRWGVGLLFSLPSVGLGIGAMGLFHRLAQLRGMSSGLMLFTADLCTEPLQAGLSVGVGKGLESVGATPESTMTTSERFRRELFEGLPFFMAGNGVGKTIDRIQAPFLNTTQQAFLHLATLPPQQRASLASELGIIGHHRGARRSLRGETPLPPDVEVLDGSNIVTACDWTRTPPVLRTKRLLLPGVWSGYIPHNGIEGGRASVTGNADLNGQWLWPLRDKAGPALTINQADTILLYHYLEMYLQWLEGLGYNPSKILGSLHQGRSHSIRAKSNDFKDANAYAHLQEEYLSFGYTDRFHVAAEGESVFHEAQHLLLYHIMPDFNGIEARAVHESSGDLDAAFCFDNPVMSEPWVVEWGGKLSPEVGLLTVKNNKVLSKIGSEPHARGEVYSGFWWSLYEGLQKLPQSRPTDALRFVSLLHEEFKFSFSTRTPRPADVVDAALRAVKRLEQAGQETKRPDLFPYPRTDVEKIITEEGKRRQLLSTRQPPSASTETDSSISTSTLRSLRDSYRQSGIRFQARHEAASLNGSVQSFRQLYEPQTAQLRQAQRKVEVVERGLIVWRDSNRKVIEISRRDVRQDFSSMDETIDIPFPEAVDYARKRIEQERDQIQRDLANSKSFRDQQALKGREKTLSELLAIGISSEKMKPRLVIVGDENRFSYTIDLGVITIYVPTRKSRGLVALEPHEIGIRDNFFVS
ncbi:MAG: hypothetical protein HY539_05010 [Deltaproteobacteria bacterium]|nr:hypothetical protein [Deltaproteobacteria bacterium]